MGMSARFATQPDVRARGAWYRARARDALKEVLEQVSVETLQACILVGNNCMGDCDMDGESLYLVLASRIAQLLELGRPNASDDGVTSETKRRIYWTCFIIDTWVSGGSNVSRCFGTSRSYQRRLPMNEAVFAALRSGEPDVPDTAWSPGLWAHMVKLVEIYAKVQDLHRQMVYSDQWDEHAMDESVGRLEAELISFDASLDSELSFSKENLVLFIRRDLGGLFIAFHLGYHHYYTLVFYQYLDQRRPRTANGERYARECKRHASIICDVLKASRETPGAKALYNIVGHVTIVSSSVLLHTYLFGDPWELDNSRRGLESNLASLIELRSYWSSIELMINRLVVFQRNCINSMGKNTYRFDKWMVKFLTAHALAMEEKIDFENTDYGPQDQIPGYAQLERGRVTQSLTNRIQRTTRSQ
ncbi:hypothetical protein IQ07DRAFT_608882 [Pyrenochaeta sp. DS3sAY3a]|nr:hypothetical protein IQ07DRAFT_608882 [Pyrenochaeta sp. DS3sAY3a]